MPTKSYHVEVYTNANQVLLGKAFTSTPIKSHQTEFIYQHQPNVIKQSFQININQVSLNSAPN